MFKQIKSHSSRQQNHFFDFGSSGLMVTFSHSTKIDISPLDMDLKCVNFGGACVNFGGAV